MVVVRVLAFAVGAWVAVVVLTSAIRTVVVPRGEQVRLTRWVFRISARLFALLKKKARDDDARERYAARYAPMSLIALSVSWSLLTMFGFTLMFWALDQGYSLVDALELSGSSITTLGFVAPQQSFIRELAVIEALLGLGLVALLISFLPTLYSLFSKREAMVVKLDVRAGSPPTPFEMLQRFLRIGWIDHLDDVWEGWEDWFTEMEESHTSHPTLVFFRSQRPDSSWITAAGCVLDTASLVVSTLDLQRMPQASVTIRSGFMSLRAIAGFYGVPVDLDPPPNAPISIHREEFDLLCRELAEIGIPLRADLDQAWRDFAGWRVNYDLPLLALCRLVDAPPAPWSSDRCEGFEPPGLRHRRWRIPALETGPSW